jgi:hypothetical protein
MHCGDIPNANVRKLRQNSSLELKNGHTLSPMKPKPQSEEYKAFEALLGDVLQVSKQELNKRIEQENSEKRVPKSASPVVVSPAKPN